MAVSFCDLFFEWIYSSLPQPLVLVFVSQGFLATNLEILKVLSNLIIAFF